MTVESQVNKTEAMVMGSSATYDFSFHVLLNDPTENEAKQAIKVSISDGETTTQLEYGTDYTVSLNDDGNGGTVTVADMKTSDYSLIIYREYDLKQGSDYQNYNSFPADTLEGNLDKNVMIAQQMEEKLERAVLVDRFSSSTPNDYALKIEALYDIREDISTDAQNMASITAVKNNATNINTVAGGIANVNAVGNNIANVNAVAGNATNINAVNANKAHIDTVAGSISNVNTVAGNVSNVNAVGTSISNVNAVAGDLSNINVAVANMESIDAAPHYAELAEKWAVQMGTPVEGNNYSAKKYAIDAQEAAAQAGKQGYDPLFTVRSFPSGVHPSPLSWVQCNNTTINGNVFSDAYAALVDGDPVGRTVTQIKPLVYGSNFSVDGLDITLANIGYMKSIPVRAKDLSNLTALSTDLDNNTLTSFKYAINFQLDLSNASPYSGWMDIVNLLFGIAVEFRKNGNQYQFRPKASNISGTAVSCDIMNGDYDIRVSLEKSGSSFVLKIKVEPPVGTQVSSSYTTSLSNSTVKYYMNRTDSTYGGKTVSFGFYGTGSITIKTSPTMFIEGSWHGTSSNGDNLQNLNETYVDYGYTGEDVYDLKDGNVGTVTIPYKKYDGKKFITVANRTLATTVYNKLGSHPYYSVDTTNHNFIVPAKQYGSDLISSKKQYWMLNSDGTIASNYGNNFAYCIDRDNGSVTFQIEVNEGNATLYFPFPVYVDYVEVSTGSYTYNDANNCITFSDACTGMIFARAKTINNSFINMTDYCLVGSHHDPIEIDLDYINDRIENALDNMNAHVSNFFGQYIFSEYIPYKASWLLANGEYNAASAYPDMWNQLQLELDNSYDNGQIKIIDEKPYVKRGLPVVLSSGTITDYAFVVNSSAHTFRLPVKVLRKPVITDDNNPNYLLFYVGNTVENIERIDAGVIAGALPFKANRDLDNLTLNGTGAIVDNVMPSGTVVDITAGASGSKYTMPFDGYLTIRVTPSSASAECYALLSDIDGGSSKTLDEKSVYGTTRTGACVVRRLCKAGHRIQYDYSGGTVLYLSAEPLAGEQCSQSFIPVAWWDEQHIGDVSTKNLKAWLIYPYSWDSTVRYAFTASAVPEIGDTVWLVGTKDGTTATQVSTITQVGRDYYNSRAIQIAGSAAQFYYRDPHSDRDEAFIL